MCAMLRLPAPIDDLARETRLREPGGPTRRRFLQGAAVAGGVTAAGIPTWLAERAAAATPVATTDGIVVVVTLLGGNDSMSTLVPISGADRGRYTTARPTLAYPASSLLPVGDGTWGLHPYLTRLAARYAHGSVALVRGVGTNGDGSHFATRDTMMAGTATTDRSTGWLGRYADGLTEWGSGFRELAVGSTVPLHLIGDRVDVTALPSVGTLWGSDTTTRYEQTAYAAIRAMAAGPTGLGAMADATAAATRDAVDRAATVRSLYGAALPTTLLSQDLALAARAINADLGTRCLTVSRPGWDTHAMQAATHNGLLTELDQAIELFFTSLSSSFRNRVTMLVVSEFGRRFPENAGRGTDHGAAGIALVIGENVKGGLYGAHPSLATLDAAGGLVPTVDIRSVYASLLDGWLDGDASGTLGGVYEDLRLFRAGPGVTPAP
jgi:uncharacterized protein (DUF1501 family)